MPFRAPDGNGLNGQVTGVMTPPQPVGGDTCRNRNADSSSTHSLWGRILIRAART